MSKFTQRNRQCIGTCIAALLPEVRSRKEVAAELGISWQAVQQIEAAALYKIFTAVRQWAKRREINKGNSKARWIPSDDLIKRACPLARQRSLAMFKRWHEELFNVDLSKYIIETIEEPMLTPAEETARRIETEKEAKALGYAPVTVAYSIPAERPAMRRVIADLARNEKTLIALVGRTDSKLSVWRKN